MNAPMKNTDADRAVSDRAYAVTADELRQFVERFEQLDANAAQRLAVIARNKADVARILGAGK